jgi:pseudoazurin
MFTRKILATLIILATPVTLQAETFDILMKNAGEAGRMVFEPDMIAIAPGDTLRFVATDRGHNAASIDGMAPDGTASIAGKINEEIEVSFDTEGWYGIQCTPHFAMGMVLAVKVGEASVPEGFLEGRLPRKARERFEAAIAAAE